HGRSASGGSDAIDPGVPDHRDPVTTSHTARSNPGSTGRAPPLPGTIRQRLRGEGNDHHHRATRVWRVEPQMHSRLAPSVPNFSPAHKSTSNIECPIRAL